MIKNKKEVRVNLNNLNQELKDYIDSQQLLGNIAVVDIIGNSMIPTIEHYGKVIIDMKADAIDSGYPYVFEKENMYPNYDGKSFCKRLHLNNNGTITIKSENAKYNDINYDSLNEIKIIGKVLAASARGSDTFFEVDNRYIQQYFIPVIEVDKKVDTR